jgi:charged multivesicular body protein 1
LKFTAKQFERDSKKALKDEAAQKKKVKQAIEKGNMDGARIYAQNAIRKKNESQNYLRLASRLEAVSARMDTAIKMNKVTKTMGNVVGSMDTVLGTMNVEKVKRKNLKNLDFNHYG